MARMKTGWLLGLLLLTGCAMVTVNVYFPKEDVVAAIDTAENTWMRPTAAVPAPAVPAPAAQPAAPGPQSARPSFSLLASPAYADETSRSYDSSKIWDELQKMDEVQAAFRARGRRLAVLKKLLSLGVIGITSDGLVTELPAAYRPADAIAGARDLLLTTDATVTNDSATPQFVRNWVRQYIAAECADRNVAVTGIGRVLIILLTRENPDALENDPTLTASMNKQARSIFAEREIERAQGNWWIQLPDNSWSLKSPPPPPPAEER